MITAKQLRRPLRFLILAGLAITAGLYLKTRHPPEKLTLQPCDRSMEPVYYPGSAVKARRIDADFELRRGQDVLYTVSKEGKETGSVGRVQGLPGDIISTKGGVLHCNGERIGPRAIPEPSSAGILGKVPEGELCILNVNPEPQYSDSRQFGFIPRGQVQAIILGGIK